MSRKREHGALCLSIAEVRAWGWARDTGGSKKTMKTITGKQEKGKFMRLPILAICNVTLTRSMDKEICK
jgi:hypothetical protein